MDHESVPRLSAPAMTVDQTFAIGKLLAASGFFADTRDAAQAVVKVLAGRELGIGPVASMTGIYVVKGRITLSANLIAAAVRRSGRYDYRVIHLDEQCCEIDFLNDGKVIGKSPFSLDDAKRAGLSSGDNWKKYPRNMLFARAMSNGAKWYCPDVFGGPVYTPDEIDSRVKIDPETGDVLRLPTPAHDVEALEVTCTSLSDADLQAHLLQLLEETQTDVTKLLTHYGAASIAELNMAQCAEAIAVLSKRKCPTS